MHPIITATLANVISWRTLAIIFALLNLKSLPFAWHLRLCALMLRHGRPLRRNISHLKRESSPSIEATQQRIHPIFRPVSIACRTSLYETDYNLHKSNSTYFADLDHSRTALVASLLAPALAHSTLKKHGEKAGALYPILGSVHTSFLREIKPLEAYTVRSRLLGWDRKWLVILSYFVRPATKQEKAKARKEGKEIPREILLACALNKYVVKQGRKTIDPGLALAGSGWFRPKTGVTHAVDEKKNNNKHDNDTTQNIESKPIQSSSAMTTGSNTPIPTPSQTSIKAAETVSKVVRRLSSATKEDTSPNTDADADAATKSTETETETTTDEKELGGWTWTEINNQRLQGLEVAQKWLNLDTELRDEYLREME